MSALPAQVTEAHKALWTKLYNLAHDEIFDVASSDGPATKLLAESESKAVEPMRILADALAGQCEFLASENRKLMAEVETLKQHHLRDEAMIVQRTEELKSVTIQRDKRIAQAEQLSTDYIRLMQSCFRGDNNDVGAAERALAKYVADELRMEIKNEREAVNAFCEDRNSWRDKARVLRKALTTISELQTTWPRWDDRSYVEYAESTARDALAETEDAK